MADLTAAITDDKNVISRRLLKINKSLVLIIPFKLVRQLDLRAGQALNFSLDNDKIILSRGCDIDNQG